MSALSSPTGPAVKQWLPKLVLLLVVVAIGVGLWVSGFEFDLDAFIARVESAGMWGPVIFLLTASTIPAAGLSMHPFLVTAGMVWPPPLAVFLGWLGTMGSALVGFLFARYVARDWVQAKAPERFRRYDTALAERGFRTVLIARLVLFTTGWMQLMMGASRVKFRDYMAATAIGNLPVVVIVVLMGERIQQWLSS